MLVLYEKLKGINYTLVLYLMIVSTTQLSSQSLDKLKGQKPVTVGGFVSTNQVLNQVPTDSTSIFNYNSYYTGSLNFNIYGVSVPFTFIYTNQQGNFHIHLTSMAYIPLINGSGATLDMPV
ncbi:MAG: hypothetical protein HC831_26645 [Chloroflexia bacterium]|nr:hypothetical protein [Chloroflexia bacterium]